MCDCSSKSPNVWCFKTECHHSALWYVTEQKSDLWLVYISSMAQSKQIWKEVVVSLIHLKFYFDPFLLTFIFFPAFEFHDCTCMSFVHFLISPEALFELGLLLQVDKQVFCLFQGYLQWNFNFLKVLTTKACLILFLYLPGSKMCKYLYYIW